MTNDAIRTPVIALTMGDVAGIGPEVIARTCADARVRDWCRPIVVGHPEVLRRAAARCGVPLQVVLVSDLGVPIRLHDFASGTVACFNPWNDEPAEVAAGRLDARAGRAAYEYLMAAAQAARDGAIDAITTAPLNKAALKLAGLNYPGHTEILADVCGVMDFGMMLFLPKSQVVQSPYGLGVVHATLHTSVRSVPNLLSEAGIESKIRLIGQFMSDVGCPRPRIAVCALNPHAGENGLFGDEETRIIVPAVDAARAVGMEVTGPLPADTLFRRAVSGEFDAVVAMYHDQGHIAMKLIGFDRAVNVTLGLPFVRTSPSHGTAFDIAGMGTARPDGMIEAIRVACELLKRR